MMHFTHTSAGTIGKTVRDLRESAAELARTSAVSASDATQRQLGQYARATRRHVGKQPWMSALIAAVVGGAATTLVVAVLRSRRDRA